MARLRRSNCSAPGITRHRRGKGFEYRDLDGERIEDPATLERIDGLVIPPAWREVWICTDDLGHLQATGLDAAERKQYLYHERWRAHRDRLKFDSMLGFARSLPRLRRCVNRDLRHRDGSTDARLRVKDLTRERVLGCAVRLLDVGFFRIGSEDYAEQNESYGLTTMLHEHLILHDHQLIFDYPSKSGQRRVQEIADPEVLAVVAALKRRRGSSSQLLAYHTDGRWVELHADDVNAYIKQHAGEEFSAKDFRTWNATVLAAVALTGEQKQPRSHAARERDVRQAVKTVAAYLGNTPAVCRSSYIDPRVLDRYHTGVTIADTLNGIATENPDLANARVRQGVEAAVLEMLGASDRPG